MRVLSGFLALSITLTSLPAFASEADAKDLFSRGRELRNQGDCAGALPLFKKSFELWPQGLGSLRNLAECEEKLGHFASSRRAWLDLKRALIVSNDSKYNGWEADADAAATRLAPKIARLTITLEVKGEGAPKVFVNKDAIDSKLLDVALDRDPGTYVVRAEGGKSPVEQTITLVAGDNKSVKLTVEFPEKEVPKEMPLPPPPPEKDVTPPPPPGDKPPTDTGASSGSTTRTIGWIALGVGGAAAIGTGIFIAMRASALSDLETACPNYESGPCGSSARDPIDRGKTAATLTNVFGAVAILGIGTGLVILATTPSKTEPSKTEPAKATMRVSPWAGVNGGGAFLTGEF